MAVDGSSGEIGLKAEGEPGDAAPRAWGAFTDERPDLHVRAGSIWPSVLGLVALVGLAVAGYVRQFELDGGWMDWTRAAPQLEAPRELAQTAARPVPPVEATPAPPVAPPPASPVVPAPPIAQPAVPVVPEPVCALDGVLAGAWRYETVAVWAAHAEVHDVRGKYSVEFTPRPSCSYDTRVRKLGAGSTTYSTPRSDLTQVRGAPWGAGGASAVADVWLAPGEPAVDLKADPDRLHYVFEYMVEEGRMLGHWRFLEGERPVMLGLLRGGRTSGDEASLSTREFPCRTQCAVRCPGDEARARCERELCADPRARVVDCGPPGPDFAAPPATRAPDAPLSFYGGRTGDNQCRRIADHLAGTWTVHARATAGKAERDVQTYTLRLQPEGCTLTVKDARRGKWPLSITGSVRADGRWTLHYRDGVFEGDWMLVGRDPAFGGFRAQSGVQGTLAAYRTSAP